MNDDSDLPDDPVVERARWEARNRAFDIEVVYDAIFNRVRDPEIAALLTIAAEIRDLTTAIKKT